MVCFIPQCRIARRLRRRRGQVCGDSSRSKLRSRYEEPRLFPFPTDELFVCNGTHSCNNRFVVEAFQCLQLFEQLIFSSSPCGTTQPPCSPTSKHITSVSNGPRSFVRIDTCTKSSHPALSRVKKPLGVASLDHHLNCTPLFRRQTTTDCLRENSRHQPDQRDQHDKDISSRHIF